jgi:hypothetical protein
MRHSKYELLTQPRSGHPAKASNIRIIEEDEAKGDTAEAYQYFRDTMGRQDVPGILKCFGNNPCCSTPNGRYGIGSSLQ